jgi:hypothetical protein
MFRGRLVSGVLIFFIYFLIAAIFQWRAGAFRSELAGTADEPAHYVTGLLVHDYIAAGFPGSPLAYARDYYVHYPKIGLGHWPPVFYAVQAAWTLLFTPSRVSVILLMGAIAALLATLLYATLREEFSWEVSAAAGLLFLSLPMIEIFSQLVMAELLVAVFIFLAVVAYGRYLDTERWQPAAWFGICFALALLTKGTGIELAMIPPVAILCSRRWRLLGRFSFWLPAILVLGIAGPWYLWVPGAQHESVARFGGITIRHPKAHATVIVWAEMLGVVLTAAAIVGLLVCAVQVWRGSAKGKWIAALGVLLGASAARFLIGAFEERHLLMNLPMLMMFAVLGVTWLWQQPLMARWWQPLPRAPKYLLAGVAVAALIGANVHAAPVKRYFGFSEAARDILSHGEFKNSALLVCSDAEGEGALISEVAMREHRPGHIVLRATKMLASSDWMGWDYRPLFHDSAATLAYLETIPTAVVVIDKAGRATPHGQMLFDGLMSQPQKWSLLARYSPRDADHPHGRDIYVFHLTGRESEPVGKIQIHMESGLYGKFEN